MDELTAPFFRKLSRVTSSIQLATTSMEFLSLRFGQRGTLIPLLCFLPAHICPPMDHDMFDEQSTARHSISISSAMASASSTTCDTAFSSGFFSFSTFLRQSEYRLLLLATTEFAT